MKVNNEFWKGKRVFITGHTGFKGSWLSLWLQEMDAILCGYSLAPNTEPSLFLEAQVAKNMKSIIGDIRNYQNLSSSMMDFNPDIVIHMAAQPLVRYSYKAPIETYETNVLGTVHVLEAARYCDNLKAIVSVTSDKCYENKEWDWGYRENEPMGGHDPYSSSKGCAELITTAYRKSFFEIENKIFIASARAGNVIGGGDWAEDRLVPDIIRSFSNSKTVIIRNPKSIRPWQHVLEPLSGYLILAQKLYEEGSEFAQGWNFGPNDEDCKSVEYVLESLIQHWGGNADWRKDTNTNPHEANLLKLDCSKSQNKLGWKPTLNLDETLNSIVKWHKCYNRGGNIKNECINQILNYIDR